METETYIFLHSTQDMADGMNRRASLGVLSVPEEDDEDDEGEDNGKQEGDNDGQHA